MSVMTKKQYLSSLRSCLRFRFTDTEINDIISDMEECFDSGAAEGKTESEICLELGEPKTAAKDISAERNSGTRVLISRLAEYLLPAVCCIAAVIAGYFVQRTGKGASAAVMCVVPLIMWLVSERKSCLSSIKNCQKDIFLPVGGVMLLCGAAVFNKLPESFLTRSESPPVLAAAAALLICGAMAMMIISICRYAPKPLIAVPTAGIVVNAVQCFRVINFYNTYGKTGYDTLYSENIGGYLHDMLNILIICSAVYLLWSVMMRGAFALPSVYLSAAALWVGFYIEHYYSALDPLAYSEEFYKADIGVFIWAGGITAALAMLFTTSVILHGRRKKGEV